MFSTLLKKDSHRYFYLVGSFLTSITMFINLLRCLKDAVRIPKQDNIADNIKILSLVEQVADDVGISRFEAVYLNSELDISTFYIGRGRYLNLSVIALTYLTEDELKAVIAHECGHHHHNAMLINRSYYRSFLFFESFVKALTETISTIQRRAKEISFFMFFYCYSPIALYGILPSLYIYDLFLFFMGILIRNSEYEYYCDLVAAKYSGGNILASALQKVFDLHIAYNTISKRSINKEYKIIPNLNLNNIEKLYLENMNREFLNVRYLNPKERTEAAGRKTDTHPPLLSRIKKAQSISFKIDLSEPLFSESEAILWLKKLPGASFIEHFKQEIKQKIENESRLDSINKAQNSTGQVVIVLKRKKESIAICNKYNFFDNNDKIGNIGFNSTKSFFVDPGVHTFYMKALHKKSNELELILSGNEKIELECGSDSTAELYIRLIR
ncbi:M48 family metallopeptidase [Planktothrix pseudagardhii]|uniref:Peptidase M48 domain-containing protein n=1 Tax=Planktothrix pseudagardhii TaxID=132604 RepID=A0A9W4G2L6_9CYAN|nr:M48 family metalloprotease [Planktothrix pseudagardhii]CAD5926292.1 hypothetical protein NO713_00993 [Planktothrix pseudagardhii]